MQSPGLSKRIFKCQDKICQIFTLYPIECLEFELPNKKCGR